MQSHTVKSKLLFSYVNHPQKDSVELAAELNYPNLKFDAESIDFGCILTDTESRKYLIVTNTSSVVARYEWVFEQERGVNDGNGTPRPLTPLNQVCDILPIRSALEPGQSEKVEFVFFGASQEPLNGVAECEVEGGPSYTIPLAGESSEISFKLEKDVLDFGEVVFNQQGERDFTLANTGKVPMPYFFDLSSLSRPGIVEISSLAGRCIHFSIRPSFCSFVLFSFLKSVLLLFL
jgi:hydrocephalus-inducing protein